MRRGVPAIAILCFMALAAVVAGVLTGTTSVNAHARLKESTPAVGEVLQTSPTAVTITFTQEIQRISGTYGIDVTDETGAAVTVAPAVIDDDDRTIMRVPLQRALPPGRYIVKYKNVSDADGDSFEAGYAFYFGVQPTAKQLAEDALLEPPETSATQTFVAGQGGASPTAGTPTPVPGAGTPTAAPTIVSSTDEDDDGNSFALWFLVLGVSAAVGLLVGGSAVGYWRRQRP